MSSFFDVDEQARGQLWRYNHDMAYWSGLAELTLAHEDEASED